MIESKFKLGDWVIWNSTLQTGKVTAMDVLVNMGSTMYRIRTARGNEFCLWESALSAYKPSLMDRLDYFLEH